MTYSGDKIDYDKLLIATGSYVKVPRVEGMGEPERYQRRYVPKKVFFLRNKAEMLAIQKAAKEAKKIIIVGAGFIGTEVASSLISANKELDL
jgi:NADPH-dependent 2,4-dienoyl-CoA reductase/sulfur reductase-like enzyme